MLVVMEPKRSDVGHWAHVREVAHVYTTHAAIARAETAVRMQLRW